MVPDHFISIKQYMDEYGCQWSKPLFSKKLQKLDFVSKQAVKGPNVKKMTHK